MNAEISGTTYYVSLSLKRLQILWSNLYDILGKVEQQGWKKEQQLLGLVGKKVEDYKAGVSKSFSPGATSASSLPSKGQM